MKNTQLGKLLSSSFFINTIDRKGLIDDIQGHLLKKLRKKAFPVFYVYLGSFYYFYKSTNFLKSFSAASEVFLDGMFAGWVIRMLTNKKFNQISTEDYLPSILDFCQKENYRVFLLGSNENRLDLAVSNLKKRYKKLIISGNNGYFDENENIEVVKKINTFSPDLLIVGLGLCKQEIWVNDNSKKLSSHPVTLCVGNYLDIIAGKTKLPPKFFKKHKIRWIYRLANEPRLFKRYVGGMLVVISIFYQVIFSRKKS